MTLFMFSAPWCPSCKIVAPIAEKIAKANMIDYRYVDIDKDADIAVRPSII